MTEHRDRKHGKSRWMVWIAAIILVAILARFALFFVISGGFSGIAIAVPLFLLGVVFFWLLMSAFSEHGYIRTAGSGGMIRSCGLSLSFSPRL